MKRASHTAGTTREGWLRLVAPIEERSLAERLGGSVDEQLGLFAERMREETNTRFSDWIDHLVVSDRPGLQAQLLTLGYVVQAHPYAVGVEGSVRRHER